MGENPGRRGEGSVTNRLSHGRPIKDSAFVARLGLQISKKKIPGFTDLFMYSRGNV
jgi:hypothetical protein